MRRPADDGRSTLQVTAEHVRRSVRRRLLFANVAGALAVFTFVQLASGPDLAPEVPLWLQLVGPIAPAAVLILPGYLWGHRAFTRAIAWALEGRSPSLAERFAVLREPWRQALRPLLFWVLAAFVYGGISALFGASFLTVTRVVLGTVLGGVTTCALGYLLIERSFRPLFAHVLDRVPDRRPRTPGIRLRLLLTWAIGSGCRCWRWRSCCCSTETRSRPAPWRCCRSPGWPRASSPRWPRPPRWPSRSTACARRWPGCATTTSTSASSSTTAARSARSRPGSTGWSTGCASGARSRTCSVATSGRRWRRRRSSGARGCTARTPTSVPCSSTSWAPRPWPRCSRPTTCWRR